MDDLFKSVPFLLEARSLQAGLVNLLSLGGFRLTKWISNDKDLLNAIPAELQAQSVRTIGEEGTLPTERALGVIWDVQKIAFLFKIKLHDGKLFGPIHCPGKDISSVAMDTSPRLG